jgi:hypothetical protein
VSLIPSNLARGTIIELPIKSDRPDYPCGRAPWALVIRAGPLKPNKSLSNKNTKVKKNIAMEKTFKFILLYAFPKLDWQICVIGIAFLFIILQIKRVKGG